MGGRALAAVFARQRCRSGCGDHRQTHNEREQLACSFHRKVVDFFHLHLSCDRKACRRAHACATTDIDCYYVVQPYLKKVYYPGLRPLMREELARREALGAGPDPDEAVAPPSPARRRRR
jgi:hypothetical protein